MTISFYYADPDQNSVELQVDNFGDWSHSTEFMRSAAEFAANPIGVAVNPDLMVSAWSQGASLSELHRRAYAGAFSSAAPADLRMSLGN
jgi:hypothetical protein